MGFTCRWFVSLTRRTDIGERACKSVSCEISDSKELLNEQSGFQSPCIFPEKDLCSLDECVKYYNRKSGNLGRRLHGVDCCHPLVLFVESTSISISITGCVVRTSQDSLAIKKRSLCTAESAQRMRVIFRQTYFFPV